MLDMEFELHIVMAGILKALIYSSRFKHLCTNGDLKEISKHLPWSQPQGFGFLARDFNEVKSNFKPKAQTETIKCNQVDAGEGCGAKRTRSSSNSGPWSASK